LRTNKIPDFSGPAPGPVDILDSGAKEMDFFNQFITQAMIDVSKYHFL
jgi:hypothetical protein